MNAHCLQTGRGRGSRRPFSWTQTCSYSRCSNHGWPLAAGRWPLAAGLVCEFVSDAWAIVRAGAASVGAEWSVRVGSPRWYPLLVSKRFSELKLDGLTIRGVAQGGVETCLMMPELGLMFDVGMCPRGSLRYNTILASHGHADHLGGLFYLLSQRGLMKLGAPDVYVPVEILPRLQSMLEHWSSIEDFELGARFCGVSPGERFQVGDNLDVLPLRTSHRVPSLGYVVYRTTWGLMPEYVGRTGVELGALRRAGTRITSPRRCALLCVTGDTRIEFFLGQEEARKCRVLVHEVTSWDGRRGVSVTREWGHTHVDEIIACAERFEGDALVLVHRSLRHSRAEAEAIVRTRFPVGVRDRVHVFGH